MSPTLSLLQLVWSKTLPTPLTRTSESGECLVAYLQSQKSSAAVGHWLSHLLKAADTEAALGHQGTGKPHVEAFLTLRVLVAKICVHPAKKVRGGLLAAIRGLLVKCSYTLKESRLMLLECLCVLAVDDCEEISSAAQEFLEYLLLFSGKHHVKLDVSDIYTRLIEKLPKVMLGSEESIAFSHAQKLLVVVYYSGPQFMLDQLQSPR